MGLALSSLAFSGCWWRKTVEPEDIEISHNADVDRWVPMAVSSHPFWEKNIASWPTWREHLARSLKHLEKMGPMPASQLNPPMSKDEVMGMLQKLLAISQGDAKEFWHKLDEQFVLIQAKSSDRDPAFFTGYYSPIYKGSLQPKGIYQFPVYAAPKDLKEHPEIYSRAAIEKQGILKGKGLELCYLGSSLEAFLLQVQGSGTVTLDDGKALGLGYGGDNGKEYTSLGKILVERKLISSRNISLSSITQYYNNNRREVEEMMLSNERYIFFAQNDGLPRGSSGAIVEAFHSLATERFKDKSYRFPVHLPMLITLDLHTFGNSALMVLCQDTGSAIRGEARADIYLGEGLPAEKIAGNIKNRGQMLLLWPKSMPLPRSIGADPVLRGAGSATP